MPKKISELLVQEIRPNQIALDNLISLRVLFKEIKLRARLWLFSIPPTTRRQYFFFFVVVVGCNGI